MRAFLYNLFHLSDIGALKLFLTTLLLLSFLSIVGSFSVSCSDDTFDEGIPDADSDSDNDTDTDVDSDSDSDYNNDWNCLICG